MPVIDGSHRLFADMTDQAPSSTTLETPPPGFSIDDAASLVKDVYGLSGEYSLLGSERDQNFRLKATGGEEYMLRISNIAEDPEVVDFRIGALHHVARCDPELPVQRVVNTVQGGDRTSVVDVAGRRHIVHLVTYLDGLLLDDVPPPWHGFRDLGVLQARLARALRGYFHPAADHELFWDISRAAGLRPWMDDIVDPSHRQLALTTLDRFEAEALPRLPMLRAQVVHDDVTTDNVLVSPEDPARVAGILDFGDMVHAALVNDLAVSMAHLPCHEEDIIASALEVAAGFHSVIPLEPEELDLLPVLIVTRLAMTLAISAWRTRRKLDNRDEVIGEPEDVSSRLSQFLDSETQLQHGLRHACRPRAYPPAHAQDTQTLLKRRNERLGPTYSLFYDRPLHIVRGEDHWLFDADGKRYLDAYNNVAHVGHCHPHVVEALSRQAATLNTNTRYLHEYILDYAERIRGYLPDSLDTCLFVCTGSEANDLAWRLAQAWNGGTGAVVSKNAYHGGTSVISSVSPEDWGNMAPPDHVALIPAPDTYRGVYASGDAQAYAAAVNAELEKLQGRGHQPAALYVDSFFTSDGIFTPPPGSLEALAAAMKQSGALFVADEVQGGFGRSGEHFWSYQFGDITPDIVTLGKPIGNGHPVGLVATRREIAQRIAEGIGYFNTFGGNPVSCAAALAVLDVIEQEGLQQHARETGAYLMGRLRDLSGKHPCIGDVRGAGFCLGVDLVNEDRSADGALAQGVKNRLRDNGVLVGSTGLEKNVLKIRPPMTFDRAAADLLCAVLDDVLSE